MNNKLYIVGTPIGNLEDFSPRAARILSEVDFIAAEDTRVTLKLLNHFGIKKELVCYFEHNRTTQGEWILNRVLNGESCALVSDAGMPAISDPGEDLVRLAIEKGVSIESVPGPSAVITALAISGMPSGRFCFEGFLSAKGNERKARLASLKNESRTMIFYEAPHKLVTTLEDMLSVFGERDIAVVKELTKIHETVFKSTIGGALKFYSENAPKGEFVLVVNGKSEEVKEYTLLDALEIANRLISDGMSTSLAAKEAAAVTGIKKGDIYKAILG